MVQTSEARHTTMSSIASMQAVGRLSRGMWGAALVARCSCRLEKALTVEYGDGPMAQSERQARQMSSRKIDEMAMRWVMTDDQASSVAPMTTPSSERWTKRLLHLIQQCAVRESKVVWMAFQPRRFHRHISTALRTRQTHWQQIMGWADLLEACDGRWTSSAARRRQTQDYRAAAKPPNGLSG